VDPADPFFVGLSPIARCDFCLPTPLFVVCLSLLRQHFYVYDDHSDFVANGQRKQTDTGQKNAPKHEHNCPPFLPMHKIS
jgi:hypothetical protein